MDDIVFLGDIHLETKDDAKYVSKWMHDNLKKSDNLILMGDLIDSGITNGMGWDSESTTKQVMYIKKILDPYKVLGYVLGNHEMRIVRKTGLNPYQSFLGDEQDEYYLNNGIIIAIAHGKSSAQNEKIELMRMAQIHFNADIVALGHTHSLDIYMLPREVIGLRTGSLQRYPDYAKRGIMIPKTLGCIRYNPDVHTFEMVYMIRR